MSLNIQQEVSGTRTTGDAGILVVTGIPSLLLGMAPAAFFHLVNASCERQSCYALFEMEREHGCLLYLDCTM